MRASIRVLRRIAFLTAVGVVPLIACSKDARDDSEQPENSGSIRLALQSTAPSGNIYRLRNAVFQITDMRTGEVVRRLFGEDDLGFSPEITTSLMVGDYTVTLLSGWSLERIGMNQPSPGGGRGGADFGGRGGASGGAGFPAAGAPPIAGKGGKGVPPLFTTPGPISLDDVFLEGGDTNLGVGGEPNAAGAAPVGGSVSGGAPSMGGSPGVAGSIGVGGLPGELVQAQLLSNAVQAFTVFGAEETFINYHFRVGEELIDFSRGKLRIGISVEDSIEECVPPPNAISQDRVMLEHDVAALQGVSLLDVFTALATNEQHTTDPRLLYQQLIDSYASVEQARLPEAIHCGDERTDGTPTLNGYPITCDRRERFQFDNLAAWFPTAFVNRIDLAPENGAHCGQQRMIFANNTQGRMFLIFEAQIPNPAPEQGLIGCAPLAEFWLAANTIDDPVERGARLRTAFLIGAPQLLAAGFGPFFTPSNHTVGTGTIRSNNFDQDPWTLREFKLALDGSQLAVIPFPVAESPNGALWDDTVPLAQGAACRANFIAAAQGLLSNDPAEMSFVVDHACKNSESRNDFSEAYAQRMSPGFGAQLDAAFRPLGLSATDVANRAHFAGSCIGCHVENNGVPLGGGATSPFSLGFVHVGEFQSSCAGRACFPISEALRNTFLPRRLRALTDLLGVELPSNPCEQGGGGTGGIGGTGGVPSAGRGGIGGVNSGGATTAGAPGNGMGVGGQGGAPVFSPAPNVDIELPQASTPVEELQEQDAEIRQVYGDKTLGGRKAQVTH